MEFLTNIIKILILPFSLIYGIITKVRNLLFDLGLLKSHKFKLPVISIGNITVGGTGKTPHTEYLISVLINQYAVGVLSRGYKRKTKGHIFADVNSTADDIGDEPCQMKQKFPNTVIAVNADRVEGIKRIQSDYEPVEVIILDDAFQHRYVSPGLSLLLVDYNRPIYNDWYLPSGRLRESKKAIKRADIVIISKCPQTITIAEQSRMIEKLKFTTVQNIYFTSIKYGKLKSVFIEFSEIPNIEKQNYAVLLLTGIANPKPLKEYIRKFTSTIYELSYPDHYQFTNDDLKKISEIYSSIETEKKIIITTEKDAVRLRNIALIDKKIKEKLYFVPIQIEFLNRSNQEFNSKILEYVGKNKRNSQFHQK